MVDKAVQLLQPLLNRVLATAGAMRSRTVPPQRLADGQRLSFRLRAYAGFGHRLLSIEERPSAGYRRWYDHLMSNSGRLAGLEVAEDRHAVPDGTGARRAAIVHRPAAGSRTLVVWVHGGSWFVGSAQGYRWVTRFLADRTRMNVLSIDYRRAPENPFPAAFDDAVAAFRFAVDNAAEFGADADRVGIAGDSAGANIAAAVALSLGAEQRYRPAFLGLWYPIVDSRIDDYRSTDLFSVPLDRAIVEKSIGWYAPRPEDRDDPRCFPMAAHDLSGLPATLIAAAGVDVLRDQAHALAQRLADAGVAVTSARGENLPHGYLGALFDAAARAEAVRTAQALAELAACSKS